MKTMTQKIFLLFYALIMPASLSIVPAYSSPEDTVHKDGKAHRPNVLLIGIETLRADHVSCLGYFRNTTPTLDRLAKKGVVFSRAIGTSSWTMPATMSVFTSLYPAVHKTIDRQKRLPEGRTTLAKILKENGYLTAGFVSNPTLDSCYGFSEGFDLYDDFSVRLDFQMDLFEENGATAEYVHTVLTSEAINRAAVKWLQKNYKKQPFFMFIFYFDPHHDYIPPPPFDTVFDPNYKGSIDGRGIVTELRKNVRPPQRDLDHIIALYDGEILYTDGYISKLLEKFAEYGILNETLIIVFGDHGDEFYEHGSTAHGHSLYDELIHIPLIFTLPRVIPQNKRLSAMVSQVDVMPTILDYLDIKYNGFMQGSSLRSLIEGQKDKLHDVVYAEVSVLNNKVFSAAISQDYKFILDLNTGKKQFFDLNSDPAEQINIYAEKSSTGPTLLEDRLTLWLVNNSRLADQLSDKEGLHKVELDQHRIRELKALGYLQ